MGKIATLLYHRVINLENDLHELAVTPDHFYMQMKYLKEHYNIVRFDDTWNTVEEKSICITFDDGYEDNFAQALPILKDLYIPATIFVSTGTLGTKKELWWDELERILLTGTSYKDQFTLKHYLFGYTYNTSTLQERTKVYYILHWIMYNQITIEEREDFLHQLRDWAEMGEEGRKDNLIVGIDKLKEASTSDIITIGAHTVHHPSLSTLCYEEQQKEIAKSKDTLEQLLNKCVTVFSYPFGCKNDYNNDTLKICKDLKIIKAASNFRGIYDTDRENNEFQIPRNIVRNWSEKRFEREIDQIWKESD